MFILSFTSRYATASFANRQVEALGWGTIEFGGPVSNRLQKVSLEVTNHSSCESAYPNRITSAQFCTYSQGKDTCQSDSGIEKKTVQLCFFVRRFKFFCFPIQVAHYCIRQILFIKSVSLAMGFIVQVHRRVLIPK